MRIRDEMNSQRVSVAGLLLVVLIGCGACQKRSTSNEAPPSTDVAPAASPEQYHQGGATSVTKAKFFKGSIGSQLGLQMKLTRDGEQPTGNYFYQKVGARIDLRGTVDRDNNVALEEFDRAGKQTGLFKGSWTIDKE